MTIPTAAEFFYWQDRNVTRIGTRFKGSSNILRLLVLVAFSFWFLKLVCKFG